jgi:hypothetical protein
MIARAAVLLSLVVLAAPTLAEDPAPPASSPAEILQRARDAQGGAAWEGVRSMRLAGTLATGGLEGKLESVTDVAAGRFRDQFQLGPTRGANGWDGERAWSQDSSGIPRVDGSEEARQGAVSEAYRRAQAWWFPDRARAEIRALGERRDGDRAFQVLAVAPAGGRPFELWVGADGLFDRYVEVVEGRSLTTSFGDWREVGGVRFPFSSRASIGDGVAAHDQVVTWTEVQLGAPLADATFALPPPPAPDFGFARGKRQTTVPFRVLNGHIYADVRLNGKGPFRLLVDTGGVNLVTPAVARAIGLSAEGALPVGGVGEQTEDMALTTVDRLEVGDAFLERQTFLVIPLDRMDPVEGVSIQGLVGYELFRRFAARIDYVRQRLTLYRPDAFHYRGPGAVLPFVFNEHIPQVTGEVDGIPGAFDLDTGSRASLDLNTPFVEAHGLVERYGATTQRISGWGAGGPARGYVVRVRLLKLGPVEIPEPVTGLSTQGKGALASGEVAGNVGYGVLSRFTLYLDYARQQVVLEKNARFARRDTADRAGVWLHLTDGTFEVVEVVPGTPAAEAGLLAGDRIVSVDGVPPPRLGLHGFRTLLRERPAGTRVELRVRRGESVRRIRLVLRDLV